MTQPQTVFDRPQFKLLPDPLERMYANVSNRMEVALLTSTPRYVTVAVPTGIFTLMKDVLLVSPSENVTLAVDETEFDSPRYVLSLLVAGERLYDLWGYSEASLPAWLLSPEYAR